MRKNIVIVAVFLILISLIGTSVATWCSNDYANRRNVSLDNTGGGALTNYQVYVDLTSTPINETSLRVYNATSCGLRDHYCQNNTGGNCYGVWIEYDTITASTWNNNTAIYYTNSTASSVSSGDNTFLSFYDFEGQNVGNLPIGWTENNRANFEITADAKHGTRAGNLTFVGATDTIAVTNYTIDTISTDNDREIIYWSKSLLTTDKAYCRIAEGSGWFDNGVFLAFYEDTNINYYSGSWNALVSYNADTWYKFRIYNIDISNNQYDIDINEINEGINIAMLGSPSSLTNLSLIIPQAKPNTENFIDTFLLRKNCSNDPISTLGDEEANGGGEDCTTPLISSLTNTNPGIYNVTITWSNNQSSDCRIKYSMSSDLSSALWSMWDNDTASVSIDITTLYANEQYYYQAWAYNGTNVSCLKTDPVSSPYKTFTTDAETESEFTIVILPDTQKYSSTYPTIFTNQTQWIVDNIAALNIRYVLHVGDIVDNGGTTAQWDNANTSMTILDGNVSYLTIPGNHDYDDDCAGTPKDADNYNSYFGTSRFSGYDWYHGNYPSGSNQNNYAFFSFKSQGFLIIGLEFCPTDATIAWANNLINANLDRKVIIYTHLYMYHDDTRVGSGDSWDCSNYGCCGDCNNGDEMWTKMVSNHSNIVLVDSGHILGDGLGKRTDYIDNYPVNQILQNYQMLSNGGNGYLRYFTFKPDDNEIQAKTYSPYLKSFDTGADNEFVLLYTYVPPCTTPVISSLTNGTPTHNSVTITWTNNQSSDCIVKYSDQSDLSSHLWSSWDNDTASVSIGLVGLGSNKQYYYQAWAYNGTNSTCVVNESVSAPYDTFTTALPPSGCYEPPTPVNLVYGKRATWINYSWSAGSGYIADLYRVKLNGAWDNGSATTYRNTTGLNLGDWVNITVWAYNTTCGNLSAGYVSDEQQTTDANVITNAETNISKSEVTFNGNLAAMDGQPNVTVYFEWGFNDAHFAFKTTDQVLSSTGDFSQYVKSPFFYNNEVYKYRAVGAYDSGTEYGDTEQFVLNEISDLVERDFSEPYDMIDTSNLSLDMFTGSIMLVFTSKLGSAFWAFLLGMPFVMLWLRGDSTLIPSMLGFIGAGAIWAGFPPEFRSWSYILLVISFAGFTYGIYKKKGGG